MYDQRFTEKQILNETNYNSIQDANKEWKNYLLALTRQTRLCAMEESREMKQAWEALGREKWKKNMAVRQAEKRYKRTFECQKLEKKIQKKSRIKCKMSESVRNDIDTFNQHLETIRRGAEDPLNITSSGGRLGHVDEIKTALPSSPTSKRKFVQTLHSLKDSRQVREATSETMATKRQKFLAQKHIGYLEKIQKASRDRAEDLLNVKAHEEAEMEMSFQRVESFTSIMHARAADRDRMISLASQMRTVEDFQNGHKMEVSKAVQGKSDEARHKELQRAIKQRRKDDASRQSEQIVREVLEQCTERAIRASVINKIQGSAGELPVSISNAECSNLVEYAVGSVQDKEAVDFLEGEGRWNRELPTELNEQIEAMLTEASPTLAPGPHPRLLHVALLGDPPIDVVERIARKLELECIHPIKLLQDLGTTEPSIDSVCSVIVQKAIESSGAFLLHGFPKTKEQALALERKLHAGFNISKDFHLHQKSHSSSEIVPPEPKEKLVSQSAFDSVICFPCTSNLSPVASIDFPKAHQDLLKLYEESFHPILTSSEQLKETLHNLNELQLSRSEKVDSEAIAEENTEVADAQSPEDIAEAPEENQDNDVDEPEEAAEEEEKLDPEERNEELRSMSQTWYSFEEKYVASVNEAMAKIQQMENKRIAYIETTRKDFPQFLAREDSKNEALEGFRKSFNDAEQECDLSALLEKLNEIINMKGNENDSKIEEIKAAPFEKDMTTLIAEACTQLAKAEVERFQTTCSIAARFSSVQNEKIIEAYDMIDINTEITGDSTDAVRKAFNNIFEDIRKKVKNDLGYDGEHKQFEASLSVIEKAFEDMAERIHTSVEFLAAELKEKADSRKVAEATSASTLQKYIQTHIDDFDANLFFPIRFERYWVVDRSTLLPSVERNLANLIRILRVEYTIGISQEVFEIVRSHFPECGDLELGDSLPITVLKFLLVKDITLPQMCDQQYLITRQWKRTLETWIELSPDVKSAFDALFPPIWTDHKEAVRSAIDACIS